MLKDTMISIGMTQEFFNASTPVWDQGVLEDIKSMDGVSVHVLDSGESAVAPEDLARHDILVIRKTGVPHQAFSGQDHVRTKLIARFGVGYDHIDMEGCNRRSIAVSITPQGVQRPVASSIVALVLALAHRIREKDQLIRNGQWALGRAMAGTGLEGRNLASLGFGNIAQETFRLLRPFGMRHLAHSRRPDQGAAQELGVKLVNFGQLLREADFLMLNCPLTGETRHIVDGEALAAMKSTAYLVNTSRGALIDEEALLKALQNGQIAGAGLDVFETEPAGADNPLFTLDNVIATPHSACWTDECAFLSSSGVRDAITAFVAKAPIPNLINPEAFTKG